MQTHIADVECAGNTSKVICTAKVVVAPCTLSSANRCFKQVALGTTSARATQIKVAIELTRNVALVVLAFLFAVITIDRRELNA